MFKKILETNDSPVRLVLRPTLGGMMLPHGLQMVFGWAGGHGLSVDRALLQKKLFHPQTRNRKMRRPKYQKI